MLPLEETVFVALPRREARATVEALFYAILDFKEELESGGAGEFHLPEIAGVAEGPRRPHVIVDVAGMADSSSLVCTIPPQLGAALERHFNTSRSRKRLARIEDVLETLELHHRPLLSREEMMLGHLILVHEQTAAALADAAEDDWFELHRSLHRAFVEERG